MPISADTRPKLPRLQQGTCMYEGVTFQSSRRYSGDSIPYCTHPEKKPQGRNSVLAQGKEWPKVDEDRCTPCKMRWDVQPPQEFDYVSSGTAVSLHGGTAKFTRDYGLHVTGANHVLHVLTPQGVEAATVSDNRVEASLAALIAYERDAGRELSPDGARSMLDGYFQKPPVTSDSPKGTRVFKAESF